MAVGKTTCHSLITLLSLYLALVVGLTACKSEETLISTSSSSSTRTPIDQSGTTNDHLAVSFDHTWQMNQSNSLNVTIPWSDKPIILAVELIPQFSEPAVWEKPIALHGTPVVDYYEEIDGYLTLYRVEPSVNTVQITYPAVFFDPALYDIGTELLGWKLKLVLTSQIDAYPVYGGRELGKKYTITTQDVKAQRTWIISESEDRTQIGSPTDDCIVVPDSTSGVFLYYPLDMIVDSVTFTSDLTFDFNESAQ